VSAGRCERGRRLRAFTLLEVMMAVTIFGIVALTVYGTFARTLRSKQIAEERAELTQEGRSAVGRIADELASAYYPDGATDIRIFRSLRGGTESLPLDSISFSALSSRPAGVYGRDTDQRVISYFFPELRDRRRDRGARDDRAGSARDGRVAPRDDGRGAAGNVDDDEAEDFFAAFGARHASVLGVHPERLLRREALMSSREALDAATPTAFLDDVASLAFRFHNGVEWLDAWDSEDRANYRPLPRAAEIDLGLYDDAGEIHHFVTAVDLALADPRSGPRSSPLGASPKSPQTPRPRATP
jgi:prepilin-type N-terminal cleavage/methylation domain-containing protein